MGLSTCDNLLGGYIMTYAFVHECVHVCVCDNSIEKPFLDSNVWRGLYRSGVNLGLIILEMRKAIIINLRTSEKYYKMVNNFIHGTYIKMFTYSKLCKY